jgi:hypothetical protein
MPLVSGTSQDLIWSWSRINGAAHGHDRGVGRPFSCQLGSSGEAGQTGETSGVSEQVAGDRRQVRRAVRVAQTQDLRVHAAVAGGVLAPETLLDTYHAERHPVAARVLRNTMAQIALLRHPGDERTKALRDTMSELLGMDEPRRRFAAMMSGLDIHYDLGDAHPLLGRRMPDLDLVTAEGPVGVFTLLHHARPVLLNFGDPGSLHATAWADRVQSLDTKFVGDWNLPVLGGVADPTSVLIRPDGYVCRVGDGTDAGLSDALTRWFGPPTTQVGCLG